MLLLIVQSDFVYCCIYPTGFYKHKFSAFSHGFLLVFFTYKYGNGNDYPGEFYSNLKYIGSHLSPFNDPTQDQGAL